MLYMTIGENGPQSIVRFPGNLKAKRRLMLKRIEIIKRGRWEKLVNVGDAHFPYHDEVAMDLMIEYVKHWKPQIIVHHEWEDFYDLSKFNKDPERIHNLQDEIDISNEYRGRLREVAKDARMIYVSSNHSNRLEKYLWHQAPALSPLRSLKLVKVLDLDKTNTEYMDVFVHRGVLYKHGDIVSVDSGMTERREFYREGMSGSSGHTHRIGSFEKRMRGGTYQWNGNGCLCLLDPPYMKGIANWMQGFGKTIYNLDGDSYDMRTMKILGDKMYHGDTLYKHLGGV